MFHVPFDPDDPFPSILGGSAHSVTRLRGANALNIHPHPSVCTICPLQQKKKVSEYFRGKIIFTGTGDYSMTADNDYRMTFSKVLVVLDFSDKFGQEW